MTTIQIIKNEEPPLSPDEKAKRFWQHKINLYHFIQKFCNRPGYFWSSYRWSIPSDNGTLLLDTEEAIAAGWIHDIYRAFGSGEVDPQVWCDTH